MSSGFVSGGTNDAPIQRDDAWLAAQLELEAERKKKADALKAMNEGKSLFETLEANKAAKQEAFEEANRLKNQFRALDDDEIGFLEELRERDRQEAERVKRETAEGLDAFRKHREQMERIAKEKEAEPVVEEPKEDEWKVGKKRKAGKEKGLLGVKVRRVSTGGKDVGGKEKNDETSTKDTKQQPTANSERKSPPTRDGEASVLTKPDTSPAPSESAANETNGVKLPAAAAPPKPVKISSGLVAYESEDDDDW